MVSVKTTMEKNKFNFLPFQLLNDICKKKIK